MKIDLRHLQPSNRYGAYAVVRNLLPLFALLALAPLLAARTLAAAWSLAPLIGLFLYRVTIVMHDCVHRTLFRSSRVNEWSAVLLGAVTGIDVGRFRALHMKHHRTYGRSEDPQGFHYLGVQRASRAQFAWHVLKPLFGANVRYVVRETLLHPGNLWRAARRGDAILFATVQLLVFYIVTDGGRYLSLAFLPFASAATFGLFLSQIRGLAEHGARQATDQAGLVRSHSTRMLERVLLYDLNFNYHSAHHRWPQCPSCHLPLVHARYLAGEVPLESGMLATVIAIKYSRASVRSGPIVPGCTQPAAPRRHASTGSRLRRRPRRTSVRPGSAS
jgi:fatty acid desaturase